MVCKKRYFYGKRQKLKLKLPGAMIEKLSHLASEDERASINREVEYLLGCKLEAIDVSAKRRNEKEAHRTKLSDTVTEATKIWKTLLQTNRPKEVDSLLAELRPYILEIQTLREAIETIPDSYEPGEPGL